MTLTTDIANNVGGILFFAIFLGVLGGTAFICEWLIPRIPGLNRLWSRFWNWVEDRVYGNTGHQEPIYLETSYLVDTPFCAFKRGWSLYVLRPADKGRDAFRVMVNETNGDYVAECDVTARQLRRYCSRVPEAIEVTKLGD